MNNNNDNTNLLRNDWIELMENPAGVEKLADLVTTNLDAKKITDPNSDERKACDYIRNYYQDNKRWYDLIYFYHRIYEHLLLYQIENNERIRKGMPLVFIADYFIILGYFSLAKRYLMLTLVEDTINYEGELDTLKVGSYSRLARLFGLPDVDIRRYTKYIYEKYCNKEVDIFFPESFLIELDKNWMTEMPSTRESTFYIINKIYVKHLLNQLGEGTGKVLENLAEYLLMCIPGCRTKRRSTTKGSELDIVCSLEGDNLDFRSEFGRYFICECKDEKGSVGFPSMAKFAFLVKSIKAGFGILFAREGISGEDNEIYADRVPFQVYSDTGAIIVVIDKNDINYISDGGNFITLLRMKYEEVRLDLKPPKNKSSKK